jgi:Fe-Mn family superoxide dismutase
MYHLLLCSLSILVVTANAGGATYDLPPLPFGTSALKPMIGKRTLQIHHGKHHAKYVNTLNALVAGTTLENQTLENIIKTSYKTKKQAIFNNAAQAWNHSFYWKCLKPKGGGIPDDNKHAQLVEKIHASFGSYAEFRKQFADAANTAFGSGWAWLVSDRKGNLSVVKTIGADNPMVTSNGKFPVLTCDVWEHAYYLDYANLRPSYVDTFLDKLVDWEFVADNLERAVDSGRNWS